MFITLLLSVKDPDIFGGNEKAGLIVFTFFFIGLVILTYIENMTLRILLFLALSIALGISIYLEYGLPVSFIGGWWLGTLFGIGLVPSSTSKKRTS